MLGAIFALLSAASFALNNATVRRGVVSGTPIQAMAVSVPLGVVCFLPLAFLTGELCRLPQFPTNAIGLDGGSRRAAFRHRPLLQLPGQSGRGRQPDRAGGPASGRGDHGAGGDRAARAVHRAADDRRRADPRRLAHHAARPPAADGRRRRDTRKPALPLFVPRYLAGYLFASLAAVAYGTTPVMARFALEHTGPSTGILGGLISYVAATAVVALALLSARVRRNVRRMSRDNARWFALSGVFVAAAQGFFFAAVAVAPVMLVMPLLQLSLAFRMLFSTWLNPDPRDFRAAGAGRRGDLGRRRADGVDRHRPDRRFPGAARTDRPPAALAGVSYLPLSM